MTTEEIDIWVEDHLKAPKDSEVAPAVLQWGKLIAHKFYDIGWQEALSLWEEVHKLPDIYAFDSTQSADELIADLKEILYNARKGNV